MSERKTIEGDYHGFDGRVIECSPGGSTIVWSAAAKLRRTGTGVVAATPKSDIAREFARMANRFAD